MKEIKLEFARHFRMNIGWNGALWLVLTPHQAYPNFNWLQSSLFDGTFVCLALKIWTFTDRTSVFRWFNFIHSTFFWKKTKIQLNNNQMAENGSQCIMRWKLKILRQKKKNKKISTETANFMLEVYHHQKCPRTFHPKIHDFYFHSFISLLENNCVQHKIEAISLT